MYEQTWDRYFIGLPYYTQILSTYVLRSSAIRPKTWDNCKRKSREDMAQIYNAVEHTQCNISETL